jgi:hypothetical protein
MAFTVHRSAFGGNPKGSICPTMKKQSEKLRRRTANGERRNGGGAQIEWLIATWRRLGVSV